MTNLFAPGFEVGEYRSKVKAFPNPRNATIGRRIFTRQERPAGQPAEARWHSLDELYA